MNYNSIESVATVDYVTVKKMTLYSHIKALLAVFLISVSSTIYAAPVEMIVNGGFETGDFTGWTKQNTGAGNWFINDGLFDPPDPSPFHPVPPIAGSYDAVAVQKIINPFGAPGTHLLFQQVTLPTTVTSAVLSWSDRIVNFRLPPFQDPQSEYRVLVKDMGGSLIQEVFSTNPGSNAFQGQYPNPPNNRSFNLTTLMQSLAGQTIQLSWEEQHLGFNFMTTLDNASFLVDSPAPAATPTLNGILSAVLAVMLLWVGLSRHKPRNYL